MTEESGLVKTFTHAQSKRSKTCSYICKLVSMYENIFIQSAPAQLTYQMHEILQRILNVRDNHLFIFLFTTGK